MLKELFAVYPSRAWLFAPWSVVLIGLCATSFSAETAPSGAYHLDWLLHFLVYGGLAAVPAFALRRREGALVVALGVFLLGILIELGQCLVPERTGSISDGVMNTLGVALGFWLGLWLARRLAARVQP